MVLEFYYHFLNVTQKKTENTKVFFLLQSGTNTKGKITQIYCIYTIWNAEISDHQRQTPNQMNVVGYV